ncbi:MAG TPA: metallophosphoesterase [Myxococcota bacterium]|nr:metallophosphoesterase [Myxococcota bacterium]
MSLLLLSLALAGPRLILAGDTGEDTPVARRVAEALRGELADPSARLLALGDLYYDHVPVGPSCVAEVVARYQLYYSGIRPTQIVGVLGNHDVTNADQSGFSAEARACTTAAFAQLGWTAPDSHVVRLDRQGVRADLAVIDAGFLMPDGSHQGATPPALKLRRSAHWWLYADHYTWLSSTGKCGEAGNTWNWLQKPSMDLWLNGHAHHLEAIPVEGALAVTSGAGMQFRPKKDCPGVTGSFFVYTLGESQQGGYIRLDLTSRTKARLTPVLCTVNGPCVDQPAVECTRKKGERGVDCAPATPTE